MSASPLPGSCASCGTVFPVSSAERSSTCKACGGSAWVVSATADEAGEPAATRFARPARRAGRQRQARANVRSGLRLLGGVLAVVVVGGGLAAYLLWSRKDPLDVTLVSAGLVAEWLDGDVAGLAALHHPDGRAAFRARLDAIVEQRGWQDGFPPVTALFAELAEGSFEQPELAGSALTFDGGRAFFSWQYEPSRSRWFLFGLDITPPPLGDTPMAFRAAWSQSSATALHPFFREETRGKWSELVAQTAIEQGWGTTWPSLGLPRGPDGQDTHPFGVLPSADDRRAIDRRETVFPITGGGQLLVVRWGHHEPTDRWLVTGLRVD
jgi:hypothetical protein